jgi:hypothetical protein
MLCGLASMSSVGHSNRTSILNCSFPVQLTAVRSFLYKNGKGKILAIPNVFKIAG